MIEPPAGWPPETRDVYAALQTYRIVGASACLGAIVEALERLARAGADEGALQEAGAVFCALKPDTASYASIVAWLLFDPQPATVARRAASFAAHRAASLETIRREGSTLLSEARTVLVHDYSSTVLAVLERAALDRPPISVAVTAGAPLDKGAAVAKAVDRMGHAVVFLPDAAIGRTMPEVDFVLSGVETLFRHGDLANTIGTFPIALVARELGVPFYAATECVKIHPTATGAIAAALGARLLKPWPGADGVPPGADVRREVLDLTPARLVSGYVTERGLLAPADVGAAFDGLLRDLGT